MINVRISNPKITRKGDGVLGTSPKGSKVWFRLPVGLDPHKISALVQIDIEFDDFSNGDGIVFVNGVSKISAEGPTRPGRPGSGVQVIWEGTPEAKAEAVDMAAVVGLVANAEDHASEKGAEIKQMAFRLTTCRISRCGPNSKRTGDMVVKQGEDFYGYVSRKTGTWTPTRKTPTEVIEEVKTFNADPAGYGALVGQATKRCCFCKLHLETNESVNAGYGPICAEKFGLPWGDATPTFKVMAGVAA